MNFNRRVLVALFGAVALIAAACGDDDAETTTGADGDAGATVVVTTNILGDVVENLVPDDVEVVTIMPVGADSHDFQASAQQVAQIGEADALIVNGAGFEEGLLDVIEGAESDGVPVHEAMETVEAIEFGGHSDHGHSDEEQPDEEHSDEEHEGHDHDGDDPHFFTDPNQMSLAVAGIADFLSSTEGVDADALSANTEAYQAELEALDADVEDTLSVLDQDQRVMVTNHEVFGYFADAYDFELVGTVIPSGSTLDGTSAEDLAELAEVIEEENVPAIFADTSSSDELTQTLADEVGDVEVVELYSESLGEEGSDGGTYLDMVRTNAQRIADALSV